MSKVIENNAECDLTATSVLAISSIPSASQCLASIFNGRVMKFTWENRDHKSSS